MVTDVASPVLEVERSNVRLLHPNATPPAILNRNT